MLTDKRVVALLFSDLKGFGKIGDDELYKKLLEIIQHDVKEKLLTPENHFFINSWGDAFFICSYTPVALAEIALDMRDRVRNRDWSKYGLSNELAVRIGLHTQVVTIQYDADGHTVKDIS